MVRAVQVPCGEAKTVFTVVIVASDTNRSISLRETPAAKGPSLAPL